jgi:hypothetical protein
VPQPALQFRHRFGGAMGQMKIRSGGFKTLVCVVGVGLCTAATAQKTYSVAELRRLVDAKKYPALGVATTKTESFGYASCVAKVESIVKTGATRILSRTIVSTNLMRVEKIWGTDSATTLTCLGSDKKFITTTAPYL